MLFLLFTFLLGVDRPLYLERPVVGAVSEGSAAQRAGFLPGDSIFSINGKSATSWDNIQSALGSQSAIYKVNFVRESRIESVMFSPPKIQGGGLPKEPSDGLLPAYPPVVGAVTGASPAQKAGLLQGDTIVSINGRHIYSWPQLSEMIVRYDSLSGGLNLVVKRFGALVNEKIVPEYKKDAKRYLIGIAPQSPRSIKVRYGFSAALDKTLRKTGDYTTMIFDVVAKLVSKQVPVQQLAGPVGIIQMSGIVAMGGISPILDFMALIGINLAVLNVFPLVITDGGLLLFLLIETIRRKPLSIKTQMLVNRLAISFFIALFLFVTYNDIMRAPALLKLTH
jgi:regulator of sigma E protease